MTAEELIAILIQLPPEREVMIDLTRNGAKVFTLATVEYVDTVEVDDETFCLLSSDIEDYSFSQN